MEIPPMTANERPAETVANLMLDLSPSLRLNVWLTGDKGTDMIRLADITSAVRGWLSSDDALRARLMPDQPPQNGAQPSQGNGAAPPPQQQTGARGGQQRAGSGLFCPDHPSVQLIQSADQYQEWDEGPDGERIPAKFFCPGKENGTAKNHSVWRSKAVQPL